MTALFSARDDLLNMTLRRFPDGNGDPILLLDDDGRMITESCVNWHDTQRMTSRPDDVMLCSYPRSGTHWTWEILNLLCQGCSEDVSSSDMLHYHLYLKEAGELAKLPSPRVLATHRQFHDLPSDFIVNKTRLVLVLRDPRDVCVSQYNLLKLWKDVDYKGTFDGYIQLFLQGKVPCNSWSRWVLSYEKGLKEHPDIPYHLVHYERLKQDPVSEIGRLAEFLGVETSLVDTVAEKTQFTNMKAAKERGRDDFQHLVEGNNGVSLHYRKGTSGDWQEWLSAEQASLVESTICKQLGRDSMTMLL